MKRYMAIILAAVFIMGLMPSCLPFHKEPEEVVIPTDNSASLITSAPSDAQTALPTPFPTEIPVMTELPTMFPTNTPASSNAASSEEPSPEPSPEPSYAPTEPPTQAPTEAPTKAPTAAPSVTPAPTATAKPTPAPTATPKPTPAPTPAPTATPNPTAAPTPAPSAGTDDSIRFIPNASLPLPNSNENVPQGQPFTFGGVVRAEDPIIAVTANIQWANGHTDSYGVYFDPAQNKTSVELFDKTFPKTGNASLSAKVKMEELPAGNYVFYLYASTTKTQYVLLSCTSFKVVDSEWRELISNNLRNSYAYALQFFGSRSEFMFTYRWKSSTGRDIELQGGIAAYEQAHMTIVDNPSGGHWEVHKKAAPYYNRAVNYMKTTFIRVHGTNGDSGVIKLSSLISSFDGIWNPRFVTGRSFISHHAFGTAIDLNASMDANVNTLSNRDLIRKEVGTHLTYNGIKTAPDGTQYYDFTYDGSHSSKYREVPTTCINYLLYELAFYRAGFNWGYYYDHACDAMHFGLSEFSADVHNTSPRSLRKVRNYID